MSVASSNVCEDVSENGTLLADLERRQDDVLAQLDALDRQLTAVLRGLGVTLVDDAEATRAGGDLEAVAEQRSITPVASSGSPADASVAGPGETPFRAGGGFAKLPLERPVADAAEQSRVAAGQTQAA